MPDFPGGPLYGSAAWPFVEPAAPNPTASGLIDTIPGRLALVEASPPIPPPPPPVAPIVTLLGPVPQSLARTTPIRFSVSAADLKTIVWIYYAGLRFEEVVWDGAAFSEPYRTASTRTVVGTLQTFEVRRAPIWPEAPLIRVFAAAGGAETV